MAYLRLIASLPAGSGVYSPTCLVHCLSGQSSFSDFLVSPTNGAAASVSLNDALASWYFGSAGLTSAISPCGGYTTCTPACGVDNMGVPCNMGGTNNNQCEAVSLPTTWTATDANQRPPAPADEEVELPSEYSDDVRLPPGSDGVLESGGTGSVAATESNLGAQQQAALTALVGGKPPAVAKGSSDSESSDTAAPADAALLSAGQQQAAGGQLSSTDEGQ